ncbi:hypothetical protein N7G274_003936 [Stereocaulon virgatum]|uniref:Uncharacterized protein n=1 Tax=Stereocaulon virgatum TaxID=373712 RepID=A0ABR4ADU5_9LECA
MSNSFPTCSIIEDEKSASASDLHDTFPPGRRGGFPVSQLQRRILGTKNEDSPDKGVKSKRTCSLQRNSRAALKGFPGSARIADRGERMEVLSTVDRWSKRLLLAGEQSLLQAPKL